MSPFLFWIFALLTLIFGGAVVINRNPVASALSLVVSFLGLAALFMSLNAYFIGIIQVLVYAGAVMVLFLFIIMLLDLRAEEGRQINWLASAGRTRCCSRSCSVRFFLWSVTLPSRARLFRHCQDRQSTMFGISGQHSLGITICHFKSSASWCW